MANLIITVRWTEPCPGDDAKVVFLSSTPVRAQVQESVLESVISWAEKKAGQDWGDTIPRVDLFETDAIAGDLNYQAAIAYIATSIRYDTGEGIYDEDCPWFLEHRIKRD